ncbi:hypothetical protein NEOLEDRAFT_1137521 [Neolentinus lepideus HHB14362 ss-1]|uniref:Uncharacterized protein n=1 Tax=Neolentinus lepideus HHB14362 ss-1 TaxID=1314782 RepID=A0A165QQG8_9AGAM|nr:hypothetical protein NEOLEDRAFT_1137521 [Neolentinus lepideus HHB14362 ss-1]
MFEMSSLRSEWLRMQYAATERSWNTDYVGGYAQTLWKYIQSNMDREDVYARYLAIIQSSGTGKSRTVDELSKTHLVIPMNLRNSGSHGFPPPDHNVAYYLCTPGGPEVLGIRMSDFLQALFEQTLHVLETEFRRDVTETVAEQFREYMTAGMTMGKHGASRINFYDEVLERAEKARKSRATSASEVYAPLQAFQKLADLLRSLEPQESSSTPLVILEFDEAHVLTKPQSSVYMGPVWSSFGELRRVLRAFSKLPLFSLFLSTSGQIETLVPSASRFRSIYSFTNVGFDHLAIKLSLIQDIPTVERITSTEHLCHYGRPLWGGRYDCGNDDIKSSMIEFAAHKLLGGVDYEGRWQDLSSAQILACLAQRLPIEFMTTRYPEDLSAELQQIERHMRICLQFDPNTLSLKTLSPSEPILSEAAYWMMQGEHFDVPAQLMRVFHDYPVDRGHLGELLVMTLFTVARDAAIGPPDDLGEPSGRKRWCTVPALLEKLFRIPESSTMDHVNILSATGCTVDNTGSTICDEVLEHVFADSKMYFNHWVKTYEHELVKVDYLARQMFRGVAAFCDTGNIWIDGIIPFLYRGSQIKVENVGVIMWQCRNDSKYTDTPNIELLRAMDPYSLGIFDPSHPVDVPVIRIVFALAADTPCLKLVSDTGPSINTTHKFKTYDFWAAGLSPEILGPVRHGYEKSWDALLQLSNGWRDAYQNQLVPEIDLRVLNPAVADDAAFWQTWCEEAP